MSKKKWRLRGGASPDDAENTAPGTLRWIIIGAVTLIASAGIAVLVFTLFGGASLSKDKAKVPTLPALAADEPSYPRSSAADLLANKSFDEMTPDEVALVKSEAVRAFANAEFRASNPVIAGVDTVRRDGKTRATKQYIVTERDDGKYGYTELTSFWCDSPVTGYVDVFTSRKTAAQTLTEGKRVPEGMQPYERFIGDTDWSKPKDLGYDDVSGHRVHGVEVQALSPEGLAIPQRQLWFDVDTAQLRRQLDIDGDKTTPPYTLDWHTPPHITPEPEVGVPPCYPPLYDDDAAS